jgi:hypothetical protein
MSKRFARVSVVVIGAAVLGQLGGCAAVVAPVVLGVTMGVAKETAEFAEHGARRGTRAVLHGVGPAGEAAFDTLPLPAQQIEERRATEESLAEVEAQRAVADAAARADEPAMVP